MNQNESFNLNDAWQSLLDKFFALNQRERWMVALAVLFVFYALFSVLVEPILSSKTALTNELTTDQKQIEALQLQISGIATQQKNDPNALQKKRIVELNTEIAQSEKEIGVLKTTLISPDKMPDLLSDLLQKNDQLKLVALKTLSPKGLFEKDVTEQTNANQANNPTAELAIPIFKHGVEMTIEGRYLDLLDYVAGVEKMPWHVAWDKASLKVDDQTNGAYPLSQLTLTVYTLSLDKTWLSI